MKFIDIDQQLSDGSPNPEWLSWKKTGLSATDIPAIMHECPFRSAKDVFDDKMGISKPIFETDAMRLGKALEPIVRNYLRTLGYNPFPFCVQGDNLRDIASLDGLCLETDRLFEIKVSSKTYNQVVNGGMPNNYYIQLQWQMMIVKPKSAFLVVFSPELDIKDCLMMPVLPDLDLWERMREIANDFWVMVENETYIDQRYIQVDDRQLLSLLQEDRELKQQIDHLEEKRKLNMKKILDLTNESECSCGKYKLCRVSKVGSVDYSAIPELKDIDLNKYRKPSSHYWQIKEIE